MDIETTKPNVGRINNYLLSGNHNFEIDRIAAEQFTQLALILPSIDAPQPFVSLFRR